MIFKKCFSTIIVVEGVLTVSSNELQEAVLPWCRKGGVMVSVGDLRDEDGWWNSANNSGLVGVGKMFLLWGGKGNDKDLLANGGSLMLGDMWTATTRIDKTFLGNGADITTWNQVLLDPNSSPDARWKSGGDVFHGYFLSFGGDDFLDFMNDLWVLPLAPAIGIENKDESSSSRNTLKVKSMTSTRKNNNTVDKYKHSSSKVVSWGQPVLHSASKLPPNRRGHTVTTLPGSRKLLVIGGRQRHRRCLDDAWVLPLPEGDLTMPDSTTDGLGWNKSAWIEISGVPGLCRWGHAATLVTDPATSKEGIAVFGGRKYIGSGSKNMIGDISTDYEYNNELWLLSVSKYDGMDTQALKAAWTLVSMDSDSQKMPAKRDHQSMSYDHASESVYIFGGRTSPDMLTPNTVLNDLWKFDLASKTWTQMRPSGTLPQQRFMHVAAFATAELVVFGGERADNPKDDQVEHKLNDLWAYSVKANTWRLLSKSNCECINSTKLSSTVKHNYFFPITSIALGMVAGLFIAIFSAWILKSFICTNTDATSATGIPKVVVQMTKGVTAGAVNTAVSKNGYERIN